MKDDRLYQKFRVERTDPMAQARHWNCVHFVLDLTHDPHALSAALAYAQACEAIQPGLASDLRQAVMRSPARRPT